PRAAILRKPPRPRPALGVGRIVDDHAQRLGALHGQFLSRGAGQDTRREWQDRAGAGGSAHLPRPVRPYPLAFGADHRIVPAARLSGGAPARDPAAALFQSADDHGAAALLDLAAGADDGL